MKLIFAVLDVSLTMGLTRCYKTEDFLTFIFAVFVHISIRYTRLRMQKSICIPNFDEITQFTAEIKLLPVSDDGSPTKLAFYFQFPYSPTVYV